MSDNRVPTDAYDEIAVKMHIRAERSTQNDEMSIAVIWLVGSCLARLTSHFLRESSREDGES